MYITILTFHILAATIWTGGHLILSTVYLPRAIKNKSPEVLDEFEPHFEKVGVPALIIQIVTGLYLAYRFQPNIALWFSFSNAISINIFFKLACLLATILLALHARLKLLPNIKTTSLNLLAAHILAVTFFSVLFVLLGIRLHTGIM